MISTMHNKNSRPSFQAMVVHGVPCNSNEMMRLSKNPGLNRLVDNLSKRNRDLHLRNCGDSFLLTTPKQKKHISPNAPSSYNLGVFNHQMEFSTESADNITKTLDKQIEWDKTMDVYRDRFEAIQGGKVKKHHQKKSFFERIKDFIS